MRKFPLIYPALFIALFAAAPASAFPFAAMQERAYRALKSQHLIDPDRQLLSLKFVCELHVKSRHWVLFDIFEGTHNPGETSPRGTSSIVVLDQNFRRVTVLGRPYDAVPLFCRADTLYLNGYLDPFDHVQSPGNVVTFRPDRSIAVSTIEPTDYPLPITRHRKAYNIQ